MRSRERAHTLKWKCRHFETKCLTPSAQEAVILVAPEVTKDKISSAVNDEFDDKVHSTALNIKFVQRLCSKIVGSIM